MAPAAHQIAKALRGLPFTNRSKQEETKMAKLSAHGHEVVRYSRTEPRLAGGTLRTDRTIMSDGWSMLKYIPFINKTIA